MKKTLSSILILAILFFVAHFLVNGSLFNTNDTLANTEELEVHFIDVGQGDSILIKKGSVSMLIDAGDNGTGNLVVDYVKNQGVKELKYVIGTHPHSDHIGGLDDVINNFQVEKIIMPNLVSNTKTFEDVLDSIGNKGLKITKAVSGNTYDLNGATLTILAPNKDKYQETNNYSVVVKVSYGDTSYIFTGDAEVLSEKEILDNYLFKLRADVLKLGHHGSTTSTSQDFLDAINPTYGVITVGVDNRYNHPDKEILDRLESNNINVYRTDLHGTIISYSDGKNIEFKTVGK